MNQHRKTWRAPLQIPLLAALLATAGAGQAQQAAASSGSSVSIYGFLKADVEVVSASGEGSSGESLKRLSNNLSVLGFRASEDLGRGLVAWAQIESNARVDTGDGPWGGRNTGIGLRSPWGDLLMGQWETPLRFVSVYAIDPFTAGIFASNGIMGNGFATAANAAAPSSFDRRQPNLIQYSSPVLNGISGRIAYALSEEKTATTAPDLISGLLSYNAQGLYLAWGHERHRDYFGPGSLDVANRLGAAYSFGKTRLRAAWERLQYEPAAGQNLRRDAWQLAVTHDIGQGQLRASYVRAEKAQGNATQGLGGIGAPGVDSRAQQVSLGYGYHFSKRTEVWGAWTLIRNGQGAIYNLSANSFPGLKPGQDPRGLGLGITHKF